MSVDYNLIGKRIKQKRTAAHITQERLAEMINVSVGYISQIERCITKPNLDMLSEIGNVLDCDICYFITGADLNQQEYLENELEQQFGKLNKRERRMTLEFIELLLKNRF
ncbi:MAG: helix-turn-helix transcriptional regulator [Clostridiales bacterium]|nr:helix-turn-helix transcriptional regulator [Clostridiales bacterium]